MSLVGVAILPSADRVQTRWTWLTQLRFRLASFVHTDFDAHMDCKLSSTILSTFSITSLSSYPWNLRVCTPCTTTADMALRTGSRHSQATTISVRSTKISSRTTSTSQVGHLPGPLHSCTPTRLHPFQPRSWFQVYSQWSHSGKRHWRWFWT